MKRMISLAGGEPEFDTPKHIIDAMKKAIDEGHTHYGDFRHIPELREAVAGKYRKLGVSADPELILITPGSTMAIFMAFKTLLKPGDDLLTMDPSFFGYYQPLKLVEGSPVPVPRYKKENWKFHVDDLYEKVTKKTKAILLCSPDNPTGAVLREEELKAIADFAREKNLWVISDDIYDEITYDGFRFRSIASLPGMKDRTIILNGLSKTYAMTGWRVGYIIAPSKEIYDRMFSIQMCTYLVVNAALQIASLTALTGPQESVREMVSAYKMKRDYLLDRYEEMPKVSVTKPEGAFYLFPSVSAYGLSSAKMAEYLRNEAKVAVTPGHLFGTNGEGHFRNAYAQPMADLEEGIDRIKEALGEL